MAVLGSTTLTGCGFIPDFIGAGSRMIFHQTSAPLNWTKVATGIDDRAIRIIGGVNGAGLTPGGSAPFSTVFVASKAQPFNTSLSPIHPGQANSNQATGFASLGQGDSNVTTSTNAIPVNTMRSHSHPFQRRVGAVQVTGSPTRRIPALTLNIAAQGSPTGNSGGHNHVVNNSQHSHPVSAGTHGHVKNEAQHDHTFTMTARNFNVTYVDVVVCTKN